MKQRIVFLIAAMLTANAATPVAALSEGAVLPQLKGEFLNGRAAILPEAASGHVALLLIGFSYDSRFQVEAWAKRFREDFGKHPKVTFFEIPMIGGMARMGKWFIDSGMRRGTPKEDYEHVITVYGGVDPWKQRVGFRDPKSAYLVLLDATGKVAFRFTGALADEPYQALSAKIAKLLAPE